MLDRVIKHFQKTTNGSYEEAVFNCIGVVGCSVIYVTVVNYCNVVFRKNGMRIRVGCCTLMYKKV